MSMMAPAPGAQAGLSREQIEDWRKHWTADYTGMDADAQDAINMAEVNALCDMALKALPVEKMEEPK